MHHLFSIFKFINVSINIFFMIYIPLFFYNSININFQFLDFSQWCIFKVSSNIVYKTNRKNYNTKIAKKCFFLQIRPSVLHNYMELKY